MPLELFQNLQPGDQFHFGDTPETHAVKSGQNDFTDYKGTRECHPHVAVVPENTDHLVNSGSLNEEVKKG